MRLTKGLYGSQFDRSAETLFGLRCGQRRSNDVVHNGGWYNHLGEKLGWGDLSTQDIKRIMKELEPGELFVILGESDSFWNFVKFNPGPLGMNAVTQPTVEAPGVEYISQKARLIVEHKKLYRCVDEHDDARGEREWRDGMTAEFIGPEETKSIFSKANSGKHYG